MPTSQTRSRRRVTTNQAAKTSGIWRVNGACIRGHFLLPLEPLRVNRPSLAAALRALARRIDTYGAKWDTTVSVVNLIVRRDGIGNDRP